MKWAHLPLAGGLYDQHPEFVDKMKYMMLEMAKAEEEERRKEKAKAARPAPRR